MLSVITLVRNRNVLLNGLLLTLAGQQEQDFELVVVRAGGNEDPRAVANQHDIKTTVVELDGDDEKIAYSTARNAGAQSASGEHLMFVDADTLLGPSSVGSMSLALNDVDALCTGSLLYLPPSHADIADVGYDALRSTGRSHPARPTTPLDGWRLGADHHLVWGLNMGLRRNSFEQVGRFDESFKGYAGEDTDLGRSIRSQGLPTAFVSGVEILHQHHDSFDPPVQQFRATLRNAEQFEAKWGEWPMVGWLDGFERLELIERTGSSLRIVRDPSPQEIEAARCTAAAPFRIDPRRTQI